MLIRRIIMRRKVRVLSRYRWYWYTVHVLTCTTCICHFCSLVLMWSSIQYDYRYKEGRAEIGVPVYLVCVCMIKYTCRNYQVFLFSFLTVPRLQHLSMPILIDRLVLRKLFYHAVKICQYLKIPDAEGASRILAHWACYKVYKFALFFLQNKKTTSYQ